jgi:multidrug efflux pump
MELKVVLDQADFIRASLNNIQHSIIEAILLVLVIIFLFLRNVRATLVPILTIPVSLIGSLLLLKICGFTLNTITLLAMVLSIGLVVDDAIVVLENIERHLVKGKTPLQAAISGSREIGFAIIAMTLTLASVYMPIAFIQGAVGKLFIEFAVTLAGSVLISGIVALTLSPLMCAKILRHEKKRLFPKIDHFIHQLEHYYQQTLEYSLQRPKLVLCVAGGTFLSLIYLFSHLPSEIAPKEDRGLIGVYLPHIPGKDIKTLSAYVKRVEDKLHDLPDATGMISFMGDWGANVLVTLQPQKYRKQSAEALVRVLKPQMDQLPSIDAHTWSWDSGLPGLDDMIASSEITMDISTSSGYRKLFEQMENVRKTIDDTQEFAYVRQDLSLDTPGYSIVLDPNAVFKLGFSTFQVAKTVEVFFSGQQSLFFQKEGIRYPITLEGTSMPWSLDELYLTNPQGKRISLGTLGELRTSTVPKDLNHYNQLRSATLSVGLKPDQHMKLALPRIWEITSTILSEDFKRDWTGSAKMYNKSSMAMLLLFGLAVIFIYAILAVQFENFLDPFIILLTIPLGCFGALLTAWMFNQSLNIYTEIGLVTLIGLITKHGILIVEFANQLIEGGKTVQAAIREAARLRLRPILMTTAAMIFGALPLILSSGAGIEARRAIGIILVGGLSFGTLFTLFILPKVYELFKIRIESNI